MADISFVIDGVQVTAKNAQDAFAMIQLYKQQRPGSNQAVPAQKSLIPAPKRTARAIDKKVLALAEALAKAGDTGLTSAELAPTVGLESGRGLSAYITGLSNVVKTKWPDEELLFQREDDHGVKRWFAPDPRVEREARLRCL